MRLIDADALLVTLRMSCKWHAQNSRELSLLQRDILIVQRQPTVDAVHVTRCKDCKNYGTSDCAMFLEKNENGFKEDYMWNEPTDFCSWAERKDE